MAGSNFGTLFTLTSFGESHGIALGGVIDGMPANIEIDFDAIQLELDRRRPGQSDLVSPRKEKDVVEFLSGFFDGKSTGTPIGFIIKNDDQHSKDYENTKILLNENGIVIFDDFDMEPIYNYINRKIHDKEIYIEDDQNIIKNDKHCIYRYTNEQSSGLEYFHVFLAFLSCFIIIFFAFRFYRSRKQSSLIL